MTNTVPDIIAAEGNFTEAVIHYLKYPVPRVEKDMHEKMRQFAELCDTPTAALHGLHTALIPLTTGDPTAWQALTELVIKRFPRLTQMCTETMKQYLTS